jgi:hypothetical protein
MFPILAFSYCKESLFFHVSNIFIKIKNPLYFLLGLQTLRRILSGANQSDSAVFLNLQKGGTVGLLTAAMCQGHLRSLPQDNDPACYDAPTNTADRFIWARSL